MKIGIVQLDMLPGDLKTLNNTLVDLDKEFLEKGAELVIYPSCFVTPDSMSPLLTQATFKRDLSKALARAFTKLKVPTVVPVLYGYRGDIHSEIFYVEKGQVVPLRLSSYAHIFKSALLSQPADAEGVTLDMPDSPFAAQLQFGGKTFAFVCGQEEFHELVDSIPFREALQLEDKYVDEEIDVLVYLPLDGFSQNDALSMGCVGLWEETVQTFAEKTNTWVIGVNGFGCYDEDVFLGGSYVVTPWGEIQEAIELFDTTLKVVDIDFDSEGPLKNPQQPDPFHMECILYTALGLAAEDYIAKTGQEGAALLMTGDATTSVLATLLVDALGPEKVYAVIAPVAPVEPHNKKEKEEAANDALRIAKALHISYKELTSEELDKAVSVLSCDTTSGSKHASKNKTGSKDDSKSSSKNAVAAASISDPATSAAPDNDMSEDKRFAHINEYAKLLYARSVVQAEAIARNYVSVTANDKTAYALGQDLDGSQGTLFAPFADVYRTNLALLIEMRNHRDKLIPRSAYERTCTPVLDGNEEWAAPSALFQEITHDHTYTKSIDTILGSLIERDNTLALAENEVDDIELAGLVAHQLYVSEKFRSTIPLGPVMSAYGFRERKHPIMNVWKDHFAADEKEQELLERPMDEDIDALLMRYLEPFSKGEGRVIDSDIDVDAEQLEEILGDEKNFDDLKEMLGSLSDSLSSGILNERSSGDDFLQQDLFSDN